MKKFYSSVLIFILCSASAIAGDWPAWRGPNRNGVAEPNQAPPVSWDETDHILWKTEVPGRGHSSPVLFGNQLFLTTANETDQSHSVLCFDRATGKLLWQTVVNRGGFPDRIHRKNTHATPTPTCDGERVFASFYHGDGIHLYALDLQGKKLWQVRTGDFNSRYPYGYGASPTLHDSMIIVASEYEKGGFLAAFDRKTGTEVWRTPRADVSSYSSPIVGLVAGKNQLLISGNKQISGYDPDSGRRLWSAPGSVQVTAGTVVWEDDFVFASGGFPNKETAAVKVAPGGASAQTVWQNGVQCYEQSLLVHEGHLYGINDNGIAHCWQARSGKELWKHRLSGPISASPILANGFIYATVERGVTYVFKADPESFDLVGENALGDEGFATPAISDGRIYLRVAANSGDFRKEWLYCIGEDSRESDR